MTDIITSNNEELTKAEAFEAMKQGKKVTHKYFTDNEWMKSDVTGMIYEFEDGVVCCRHEFWAWKDEKHFQTGWRIFNEQK